MHPFADSRGPLRFPPSPWPHRHRRPSPAARDAGRGRFRSPCPESILSLMAPPPPRPSAVEGSRKRRRLRFGRNNEKSDSRECDPFISTFPVGSTLCHGLAETSRREKDGE